VTTASFDPPDPGTIQAQPAVEGNEFSSEPRCCAAATEAAKHNH
jgi:hypothetical protein